MTLSPKERALKNRAAQALLAVGWSRADVAVAVSASAAQASFKTDFAPRNERIVAMYREGGTLEEIGAQFGITRERIRQVIKARGVQSREGGRQRGYGDRTHRDQQRRQIRKENRRARLNATAQKTFGCDYETALSLNLGLGLRLPGSRCAAYVMQKRTAGYRGIEWEMTLPEWCRLWEESGKWPLRGRGRGRYCMSRRGDAGPYAADNVRIILNEENIAEGFQTTPWAERFPGLSKRTGQKMLDAHRLRSEGMSCAEVGERLGIKATTVPGYVITAKKMLAGEAV